MPAGRPTTYNLEVALEICEKISMGENVVDILKKHKKYPSYPTWCKWKRENEELFKLYVNSVSDKAEVLISRMSEIEKKLEDDKISPSAANVLIQSIKWKLAKFYPKMYGEKSELDITSKGEKINSKIDLSKLSEKELRAYAKLQSKLEGD